MEPAISAVTGELVSRFVSFLTNKYHSSRAYSEEKQFEKLHQLLLRVRTVVEEADGRYITNSGMLAQLKMLADAMYQGYWTRDAFKYRSLEETPMEAEVISSARLKRSRSVHDGSPRQSKARYLLELQGALERLENVVAHMTEFVVILGGCDRMVRRPYDAYLYIENLMFGRHTEKQELSNFLLQHNHLATAPAVLPIIGAFGVGKKTLVAHVCNDERVRFRFSVILYLGEADFLRIAEDASPVSENTLVVVDFVSDVDEKDWTKFYSAVARMDRGNKVVILSRHKKSERFGTVKPLFLNVLSYEEFSYLFKTLAFGSANQLEYPRLVRIADEFARELQSEWSLVTANLLADVIRRDLDDYFWLCILSRLRRVVERNFSMYGEHPKLLLERGHDIAVMDFVLHPVRPLPVICSSKNDAPMKKELSKVTFKELLVDSGVRPKVEFGQLTWESRLPPYTSFDHIVSSCVQDMTGYAPLSRRKRGEVPL